MTAPKPSMRALSRWHRRLGLGVAAIVVFLAVSGVLLNHTEDLDLDARYVESDFLLDWYGIRAPDDIVSFAVAGHRISQAGVRVYFDARDMGAFARLLGAVAFDEIIAVAVEGKILLLTADGEPIEILGPEHGVPAGMRAIGIAAGQIAVRAAHGIYVTDRDLSRWQEYAAKGVVWATPSALSPGARATLVEAFRGRGLSVERVLRDLHSGRLFGRWAYLLLDVAALALLALVASGVWVWVRRR